MSCSPATSSNIIRPAIAATRISPTGRRRWSDLAEFDADALVPGRGAALATPKKVARGHRHARAISSIDALSVRRRRASRKAAVAERRLRRGAQVMDPKFATYAIYEHCMPFNVARAYDEAQGIDIVRVIWTAERDREMWAALQG